MYLNRRPTAEDLSAIESSYNAAGFPGYVGAVDCTHISWKNCPIAHKGQYHTSRNGKTATIVGEAWVDRRLYIWSWFCGMPGTNNDFNVMNASPLFQDILNNSFPFSISDGYKVMQSFGAERKLPYFLVDGIYPRWPIFAGPVTDPTVDQRCYKSAQESIRKDAERAFAVLTSRFQILKTSIQYWRHEDVVALTDVCVMLHNMVIECNHPLVQDSGSDSSAPPAAGQSVDAIIDKAVEKEVLSAMEAELHKLITDLERDNHQFFTGEEIDSLHRNSITSALEHDSLLDELCLLATLRHLHLLGE